MEYRPQGFGFLPTGVKHLLIINVLFYLATEVLYRSLGVDLYNWLALFPVRDSHFGLWQYITYQFMHANFDHIFFNMFALWMFGTVLEQVWGTKRFIFYYLFCGVGAGLITTLISPSVTVGASGAIYGILLAFGMLFPNERIYLYFLVPIKAKWFVIGYGLIELFEGVFRSYDGIAHFAHLGGMLFGLLLILYWKKHPFNRWS